MMMMMYKIYEIYMKIYEIYEIHMEMYEKRIATDIYVDIKKRRCERQHMIMM